MTNEFEDLQSLWDRQAADLEIPSPKELSMSLQTAHRHEQKRLFWLNIQEFVPAIGLFLWFGWQGLNAADGGWAYLVASFVCLGIGGFLVASSLRQRAIEQGFDDSTRGELERSRSQMQHRAWLYRNVAWWYLLPVAVAVVLVVSVTFDDLTSAFTIIYGGVVVALFGWLYRANRKVGRKRYEPEAERLGRIIADLDTL